MLNIHMGTFSMGIFFFGAGSELRRALLAARVDGGPRRERRRAQAGARAQAGGTGAGAGRVASMARRRVRRQRCTGRAVAAAHGTAGGGGSARPTRGLAVAHRRCRMGEGQKREEVGLEWIQRH